MVQTNFSLLLYQVFLLDSQVDDSSAHKQDTHGPANEEDDQRSYVFVLSSVENKEKPENAERWVSSALCCQATVTSRRLLDTYEVLNATYRFLATM